MKRLSPLLISGALLSILSSCSEVRAPIVISQLTGNVVQLLQIVTDPNDLSRQTKPWEGGAGVIKAQIGPNVVTVGSIDAAGKFTVTLPKTVEAQSLRKVAPEFARDKEATCEGSIKISDPQAQMAYALLKVEAKQVGSLVNGYTVVQTDVINPKEEKEVRSTTTSAKEGFLVYFDRPVRIWGDERCSSVKDGISMSKSRSMLYSFGTGWNIITGEMTRYSEPTLVRERISGISEQLPSSEWTFR